MRSIPVSLQATPGVRGQSGGQCTQWDGHTCWYECVRGDCKMAASHTPLMVPECNAWFREWVNEAWKAALEQAQQLQQLQQPATPPVYVLTGQHAQGIVWHHHLF